MAAKKAKEAEMAERERKALERAQERVARDYQAQHQGARPPAGSVDQRVPAGEVPKEAKQPIGAKAGPHGGRAGSAEAHSTLEAGAGSSR